MDETEGRGEGLDPAAVPGGADVAHPESGTRQRETPREAGHATQRGEDVADPKGYGFTRGRDEAGDGGSERVSTTGGGVEMADATGVHEPRSGRTRTGVAGLADSGGRNASLPVGGVVDGVAADVVRRSWWEEEPYIGRVTKGEENRVAKLKALGNGQVPLQSAIAFTILMGQIGGSDGQ